MLTVATTTVGLDLPSPVEAWSRLVCQDGGPLVLAALESGAARGPWAVVDLASGRTRVGRNLAPVTDGRLGPDGRGLLLTQGGLASVEVSPQPRVVVELRDGLGRGKDDHLHHLTPLTDDVVVLGRWYRPVATVVRVSTGQVLRRLDDASPPHQVLPADDGTVRVWAVGSGSVLTLDPATWQPVARRTLAAGPGLAACRTPHGTVALLGSADPGYEGGLAHALLRDLAPAAWRRRLRSPWTGLRLALLDADLEVVGSAEPAWLGTDLPDPDRRGPGRLDVDGVGRAVLTTSTGLTVLDPRGLTRLAHHPIDHPATVRPGECQAVHRSGDRELTVVEWG